MEQANYYRKYIILEELDQGFGVQHSPEGFIRLEGTREELILSLQVKHLREGAGPYTIILVYAKNHEQGVFRAGNLEQISHSAYWRRNLDNATMQSVGIQPENLLFILIASENRDRVFIPMVGIANKSMPWDEAIRQRLLKKDRTANQPTEKVLPAEERPNSLAQARADIRTQDTQNIQQPVRSAITPQQTKLANKERQPNPPSFGERNVTQSDENGNFTQSMNRLIAEGIKFLSERDKVVEKPVERVVEKPIDSPVERSPYRVDDARLERKLKEAFQSIEPFSNPRHDYVWYKVNDLAKLSNLLFACNMRIPLFANPKILVGLFKYRHLLTGFYRSEENNMNYFVLGIPARDNMDGKPFENICRWVESQNREFGDMTGYWLVYINLRNGEFVS